jgi:hypothetical protein
VLWQLPQKKGDPFEQAPLEKPVFYFNPLPHCFRSCLFSNADNIAGNTAQVNKQAVAE